MRLILSLFLLASSAFAWAEPPTIEIPAEVKPTGDYVTVKPKTNAVAVLYVGLSNLDGFPSEFLKDPRNFVLPTRGLAAGRYGFAAVASSEKGEQTRLDFVVVIAGVVVPPPVDPVKPIDIIPVPTSLYFLIVRDNDPPVS